MGKQKGGKNMSDTVYRRFIPIGNEKMQDRLVKLIREKDLSHDDLILILRTIKLNPGFLADTKTTY